VRTPFEDLRTTFNGNVDLRCSSPREHSGLQRYVSSSRDRKQRRALKSSCLAPAKCDRLQMSQI
jgi:hypothetical protein